MINPCLMKKTLLMSFLLALSCSLTAQVSEGGLPPSYKLQGAKSTASIATHTIPELDTAQLMEYNRENNLPLRYGVINEVNLDLRSEASVTVMPDGGTIWQYRINSPYGKSVQVIFKTYFIPEKAELYLYDENYENIAGAYTVSNMTGDLTFVTADFPGNHVIIEYYEPADVKFKGQLIIGWIGQSYIDVFENKSRNVDANGYIPVNCDEGIEFQDQKHSVCKYSFNDNTYSYLCSGALINNTRNDGTPYFLTANHCVNTQQEASTVVAYFNYEDASCSYIVPYTSQTLTGATLMTTGKSSDYTLLEFNNPVPSSYQPYFAGWDISESAPLNSVCIHHPNGEKKKIAVDNDPAVSYDKSITWEDGTITPANSHWQVDFDEGVTYSGSSGGPLFDQNKNIVGQLHGGNATDYFGKLGYSWLQPNITLATLQSFLDPDNSGATFHRGYYPADNLPDPQFVSDFTSVCINSPVLIKGFSAFEPLTWEWSFLPGKIEYYNGTDATSKSPFVAFKMSGTYDITLTVTNSQGTNKLNINDFIVAGSSLALETYPSGLTDSCISTFHGMFLQAYGADAYLWSLSAASDDYFYIVNNTANPVEIRLIDGVQLTQSTDIEISLTGIQGTCESLLNTIIPLEAQTNDDIINAIELKIGANGPFSNKCATIEPGEPVPPYVSCTGQLSWCDEYGTGKNIVENSVWFFFNSSANQEMSLYSVGMDNEIAVYRAATWQDVLSGNYELIAANDDYTDTDYNPKISSMNVMAGQKYWVQVDGSGGGVTGTFYLTLNVLSSVNDMEMTGDEIKVYPQPAEDIVKFQSALFSGYDYIRVELFNERGEKVDQHFCSQVSGIIQLPLYDLPPGAYFARVFLGNKVTTVKIIR
jgi:PKD repeat protein